MRPSVPQEWRPKQRWKRRFYAVYMRWLERLGYLIVLGVIGAFLFAFNYKVDELIKADGVSIEPEMSNVNAVDITLVTKVMVKHGQEVKKGTPLLKVVSGELNIETYRVQQVLSVRNVDHSVYSVGLPKSEVMVALSDGVVIFEGGASPVGKIFEIDQTIARVANFNDLRAKASLGGQSVAAAEEGSEAIISAVLVEPVSGILFRGASGGTSLVSGQLFQSEISEQMAKLLDGKVIAIPNDRSFKIKGVSEIQVDGIVQSTSSGNTSGAVFLEPTTSEVFRGKVLQGSHKAQYQLGALPPELRASIEELLRKEAAKSGLTADGQQLIAIQNLSNINLVVKGDAESAGTSSGIDLRGVATKRTFDAEIRIENPSPALREHVRLAMLSGRKVTVRIEVKTGNRPIAFTLLKKS